ncbi:hypothetical protein [Pseudonocardia adelaidensis]|uniref:Cell division protein FtsL n=1 Tax=Pseudonocardia adelaidensis TaxID=648754 RepID=A0ABP9NGU4_9PSEU
MSAPVTERGRTAVRGRTAAIPAQRGLAGAVAAALAPSVEPAAGARRPATQKASTRADQRARRGAGARPAKAVATAGRPQFVLLIMVLLAVGLVATLWLSTAAAADSYRLQDATADARVLSEQAERLKQDVAVLESAPELARRAGELGMVPVRDPARLVVAVDGAVDVVGQPRAAVAPPPPPPPAPPAGAQPPAPGTEGAAPEGTTPEGAHPDGANPDGANPDGAAPEDAAPEDATPEDATEGDSTPGGTASDGSARLAASDTEEGSPGVDGDAPAEGARGDGSGQHGVGAGGGAVERAAEARAGDGATGAG